MRFSANIWGLSPRGRGNPGCNPRSQCPSRSIPAWAGEPEVPSTGTHWHTVYPRVGGGTISLITNFVCSSGLSPRGRGNRRLAAAVNHPRGSIPAWAGEPFTAARIPNGQRVYPRVGGGTSIMRCHVIRLQGLSPRGRGNLPVFPKVPLQSGSIPAWAGEPAYKHTHEDHGWVYPRVGGGTPCSSTQHQAHNGLSPRGRGNRLPVPRADVKGRSIPAWAGEPCLGQRTRRFSKVYPRVGGGTQKGKATIRQG